MNPPDYDVVITGAGPVGSTLALLLARKAPDVKRIALIGKHFMPRGEARTGSDPRTLALNHGSRVLLENIGAWPAKAANIEKVHVSQQGRLGRTLIDAGELGVPRLGSVVPYVDLVASLHQALESCGVELITADQTRRIAAPAIAIDADGRRISAQVAVQSDGNRPHGIQRDYDQHAVVAVVHTSQARHGQAYERFTTEGPLALLPHPQGPDYYAVVWCCSPARADHLQRLDEREFAAALKNTLGDRLGELECAGSRHVFPLALYAGPNQIDTRTVAIGNAAQTLHPVAGQGLNLGLRDAAQLSHSLSAWLLQGHASPDPVLEQFAQKRRADRWLTAAITDSLPRIFATRNPLVQHACGLSLLALDLSLTLRTPLARHLLQGLRV